MPEEIRTKVVGVSHGNRQSLIINNLSAATPLTLYRLPDHKKDPYAVAVCLFNDKKSQIGYLSADRARDIAPLLDAGWTCRCRVLALTGGTADKPTVGVNILLNLQEPTTAVSPTRPKQTKKILQALAVLILLAACSCLLLLIVAYALQ